MLRTFKYPYSEIQKAQSFVNHVMLDIVFNSRKNPVPEFNSSLVNPKYKKLIEGVNDEYLLKPLNECYKICKTLNRQEIKILKRAVHDNNKIEELCCNSIRPVQYSEIDAINENLSKAIKKFNNALYDHVLKLAPFISLYGKVDDYYKLIVQRSNICRCCGINKILNKFSSFRSALDHYLPRKHYPFNSINFKNLIPICDNCNSKYKLSKDILFVSKKTKKEGEVKTRTKAFYPYSEVNHEVDIDITFKKNYDSNIEPKDIIIELDCKGNSNEVETWNRVFGIKENYKAECCSDEMMMYYEEEYIADMILGKTHKDYIEILSRNRYGNMNFLKISFLKAIHK